jgi:hypothetical protein
MKIWRKDNGNTVIEFERDQDEMMRFSYILGDGARAHRDNQREMYAGTDNIHIKSAISGYMTKVMLDTYLVGSNYTQEFGTEEEPKEYHIADFIVSALKNCGYNTNRWNGTEFSAMRKYYWEELI